MRYILGVFAKKKVKLFADTALRDSRMCLIRKPKHLCFITQRNFEIPFPSVHHNFSRLCFWLRSVPAKHRRQIYLKIFCEFGITFATEVSLDDKNIWGGVDKSLARLTCRCRRAESILSLERGVRSCAELQVFSCYRGWKEAYQATRAISTTSDASCHQVFFLQSKAQMAKYSDKSTRGYWLRKESNYTLLNIEMSQYRCNFR